MQTKLKFSWRLVLIFLCVSATLRETDDERFLSYTVDPSHVSFYWKDRSNHILGSIKGLKEFVEKDNKELVFAMNGGMYKKDNSPQGLYIENGLTLAPLDTSSGGGNFYMKPNGVFYINENNTAVICRTEDFGSGARIKFATQSGPMLLINGNTHPAFMKGSVNLNIRNGVGILPDGRLLFAISKEPVNFYDFAQFFKNHQCKNALYLDGFVSRMYLPAEKWEQLEGNFGVMIGVTK